MNRHCYISHHLMLAICLLGHLVWGNAAQATLFPNLQLKSPLILLAQETAEAPQAEAETDAAATPETTADETHTQNTPTEDPAAEEAPAPAVKPQAAVPSNAERLTQIAVEKADWKNRIWEPTWKSSLSMMAIPGITVLSGIAAALPFYVLAGLTAEPSQDDVIRDHPNNPLFYTMLIAFPIGASIGFGGSLLLQPAIPQTIHNNQKGVKSYKNTKQGFVSSLAEHLLPYIANLSIAGGAMILGAVTLGTIKPMFSEEMKNIWLPEIIAATIPVLLTPILQTLVVEGSYQMALDNWAEVLEQPTTAQQSLGGSLDFALRWAQVQR